LPGCGQVQPASIWQVALHPSPELALPSSHCSPDSTTPFLQTLGVTVGLQGCPGVGQAQPPSTAQPDEHPSSEAVFPSSHASLPSMVPLPQTWTATGRQGEPGVGHT
jgi:hypothetical protein